MRDEQAYEQLVAEKVERAMAPWVDLLPPEALAEMREQLEDFITTHPVMDRMVRQLLPAPVIASSGELDTDGRPTAEVPNDAVTGTRGRK